MKKYIGSTILFQVGDSIVEGTVKTMTPSGKYVQIGGQWFHQDKVTVLDVLKGVPVEEPPEPPAAEACNASGAAHKIPLSILQAPAEAPGALGLN